MSLVPDLEGQEEKIDEAMCLSLTAIHETEILSVLLALEAYSSTCLVLAFIYRTGIHP